jgi:hypothetical protein
MRKIQFSPTPGSRERQLCRRHGNPLFPAEKRHPDQSEINEARNQDKEEEIRFLESLRDLLQEVSHLTERTETEEILAIKERTDKLYEQCAGLGGEHRREKDGLIRLNQVIMQAIQAAAGDDPLALEELAKEQAARELHLQLLEHPIVSDLLRTDSFISSDELVPSLLSEQEDVIRLVMPLFDDEQRREILQQADSLKKSLQDNNDWSPEIEAKFNALSSKPQ